MFFFSFNKTVNKEKSIVYQCIYNNVLIKPVEDGMWISSTGIIIDHFSSVVVVCWDVYYSDWMDSGDKVDLLGDK